MRNRTCGGVRGRKTKVGRKLLRFPPTRLCICFSDPINHIALVRGGDCLKSQTFPSENRKSALALYRGTEHFSLARTFRTACGGKPHVLCMFLR